MSLISLPPKFYCCAIAIKTEEGRPFVFTSRLGAFELLSSRMRTFRLLSVGAQPNASAATTPQTKPPHRSRAGEPSMSLVSAWPRASSPIRPFPDRAAPCAEWPPKFCPPSAAPISPRPGALWKAQSRLLVSLNALHVSPRGFHRFPRERIHRPVWRRISLRAHRGAHDRWFVSLA
jgi:hypothetical protein